MVKGLSVSSISSCSSIAHRLDLISDPRYTGAIFPNGKHFVVAGGNFSVTHIHQPGTGHTPGALRPHSLWKGQFRNIRLGDLNLLRPIEYPDVICGQRRPRGRVLSRMYTVQVPRGSSCMAAKLYHGDRAAEVRLEDFDVEADIDRVIFLRYGKRTFRDIRNSGKECWVYTDEIDGP